MIFFCIADYESSLGFKFAGIETKEVLSRTEALQALQAALARQDVGIIIITEKAASYIRQEIDEILYRQEPPLILEVPSRGEQTKKKSVSAFLKEIVGVSI
jgi:V/A-type H+-transporting ATPase subunit F